MPRRLGIPKGKAKRPVLCAWILLVLLFAAGQAPSQVFVPWLKGLRVYGATESQLPVAGKESQSITIEFDVDLPQRPNLFLRFYHCDRDWKKTQTEFVNDEQRNFTRGELPSEPAPAGVQQYRFHYRIHVPGYPVFDRFPYAGNYLFELYEKEESKLLSRGKFFVADHRIDPVMRVSNRQEPGLVNPYYQVHAIAVAFSVPQPDTVETVTYYTDQFEVVDIYKNREIARPWRVAVDDDNTHTAVTGLGSQQLEFIVDNVQPGNEYRVLDLRNSDFYPPGRTSRPRFGADMSRFLGKLGSDQNGGSTLVREGRYADYVDFRFELLWDAGGMDSVAVAGDFNGWTPSPDSFMVRENNRYVWHQQLRRGVYDYQYVVGNDWVLLEGNDWRATNSYTGFVYYRDSRFGGFDRIVGVARGKSPGSVSAGTHEK